MTTKKTTGRPRKVETETLKEIVRLYVDKHKNTPHTLKTSKLAKYGVELGINVTYQDFSRNKEVAAYIETINNKFKETLFGGGLSKVPVYERIDPQLLMSKNKTPEKITKAIEGLNKSNEMLTEEYDKLQNKLIKKTEECVKKDQEIVELNKSYANLLSEKDAQIRELKKELQEQKEQKKILVRKMKFYDEFAQQYHYDAVKEYALKLEAVIPTGVKDREDLLDSSIYNSKDYSLASVVDRHYSLLSKIDVLVDAEDNEEDNNKSQEAPVIHDEDSNVCCDSFKDSEIPSFDEIVLESMDDIFNV